MLIGVKLISIALANLPPDEIPEQRKMANSATGAKLDSQILPRSRIERGISKMRRSFGMGTKRNRMIWPLRRPKSEGGP
jgi:hypothetical protein